MRRRRLLRAAGATAGSALGAGVIGGLAGSLPAADAATAGSDGGAPDEYGPLGSVELRGTREAVVSGDGRTASIALGDGYATVDVSDPAAPTVLAERRSLLADRPDGPLAGLDDAAVSGDRLIVVGPAHARDDVPSGVLVVDVSDPAAPRESAYYETDFPIHNADFDGRHCYLTGNGAADNALVVVDVEAREEVARWSLLAVDDRWRDVPAGIRPIHDVTVRDGVAALAYWDAGTYLLDVSEPSNPAFLGAVDPGDPDALRDPPPRSGIVPPGNHHVAVLAPDGDVLAVGRESWAVEHEGDPLGGPSGVDLYDVSDPAAPAHLSSVAPPPSPDPTFGGTWTTAHNLDVTGDALYTSWYQGGVKRHDVTDPTRPVEKTWWADPDATRFWSAVLAVPGDHFLAPSMGTRAGAPAGLWTFPDRAGVGGDRSRLDGEATGTAVPPMTTSTPTETEATEPTVTRSDTARGTGTASGDSSAAAPGFGVASALSGAGVGATVAAALAGRRPGRADGGDDADVEGDAET